MIAGMAVGGRCECGCSLATVVGLISSSCILHNTEGREIAAVARAEVHAGIDALAPQLFNHSMREAVSAKTLDHFGAPLAKKKNPRRR
jgi:hypothetical protein